MLRKFGEKLWICVKSFKNCKFQINCVCDVSQCQFHKILVETLCEGKNSLQTEPVQNCCNLTLCISFQPKIWRVGKHPRKKRLLQLQSSFGFSMILLSSQWNTLDHPSLSNDASVRSIFTKKKTLSIRICILECLILFVRVQLTAAQNSHSP